MSKFKQYGSITFSPTAVTDKEEVHGLHKRAEGSVSGGVFIAMCVEDETKESSEDDVMYLTCDRTPGEIYDAFQSGMNVFVQYSEMLFIPHCIFPDESTFYVFAGQAAMAIHINQDETKGQIMPLAPMSAVTAAMTRMTSLESRIEALEAAAQSTTE